MSTGVANHRISIASLIIAIVAVAIGSVGLIMPTQLSDQANECVSMNPSCLLPRTCVNSALVNFTGADGVCFFTYQGVEYGVSLGLGCGASYGVKVNSGSGWSGVYSSNGAIGSPLFAIFNYTGIMTYGLGATGCSRTGQDYWNYFNLATKTWIGFKPGGAGVNTNPKLPLYMSVIDPGHVMLHVIGNDGGNCGTVYTNILNTATFLLSGYQSTGFSNVCDFSTMFQAA
jgi:hypothetical protein